MRLPRPASTTSGARCPHRPGARQDSRRPRLPPRSARAAASAAETVRSWRSSGVSAASSSASRTASLDEIVDKTEEAPGKHDQGGWSQARFQRHIEKLVGEHLRDVADALDRHVRRMRMPEGDHRRRPRRLAPSSRSCSRTRRRTPSSAGRLRRRTRQPPELLELAQPDARRGQGAGGGGDDRALA